MKKFSKTLRDNWIFLLMVLPGTIWLILFFYIPVFGNVVAFQDFHIHPDGFIASILNSKWVGWDNFKFFFQSGDALNVTRNTVLYNLAFLIVNTTLEVGFAIVLSEMVNKVVKKTLQSVIFLPYFISWVIVSAIAYSLFNYENGGLNALLNLLGMESVNVYAKAGWWKFIITGFSAWKGVGYGMVVYLASIAGVDSSLIEAAQIDGANIFQRILYVTIPSIKPTIITMSLLAIGKIFKGSLDLFYQLIGNNGALFDATDVIDTYVFRSLITDGDVGKTAAVGLYQSVLCFVTIMVVNGIIKRTEPDYALF